MSARAAGLTTGCSGRSLWESAAEPERSVTRCRPPPFGMEWKKIEKEVRKEVEQLGYSGRFSTGLPRVSDGSPLFLLHLVSKMRPARGR